MKVVLFNFGGQVRHWTVLKKYLVHNLKNEYGLSSLSVRFLLNVTARCNMSSQFA